MTQVLVKICGITREVDARAAVACGASAIGFIFWPKSPRFIDPYRARRVARVLPAFVTPVGVFVNQPVEYVNAVSSLVGLGAVQLHGDETPAYAEGIRRPIIRAVGADALDEERRWSDEVVLLVDAHDPVQRGGTGRTSDWSVAAALSARRRVVLSGGLTPDNVTAGLAAVRPFGVDVSSGVETAPGIKDAARLQAFFAQVRAASAEDRRSEVSR
ncbi:MAG: phosphoribosylanthranilate isomerase [Acidimicrobiia bacterium]|nr:phosphoribosylanthranilate isomerase [Acidimicrobiia bacterium]